MPSTPDLHTRLIAEIERRENEARAAGGDAWDYRCVSLHMDGTSSGGVYVVGRSRPAVAHAQTGHYGPHIALHDPADALLRYAHYRKVLERHVLDHSSPFCGACSWWEPGAGVEPAMGVPWPCDEIRDLAEALAIETGDADAQHP